MPEKRNIHEEFARFFEDPKRETFRDLIRNNFGESAALDFKEDWPEDPKTARHLLGLGNSGGGCLIFGVAEQSDGSLQAVGIEKIRDKADIINGIEKYLPNSVISTMNNNILDFSFTESEYPLIRGKKFQVIFIEDNPEQIPLIAAAGGQGIQKAAIYIRRVAKTEQANYEELQKLINRRVETKYSSRTELILNDHLGVLQNLYQRIPRYLNGLSYAINKLMPLTYDNPSYPKESHDEFISRLIKIKKQEIERLVKRERLS